MQVGHNTVVSNKRSQYTIIIKESEPLIAFNEHDLAVELSMLSPGFRSTTLNLQL